MYHVLMFAVLLLASFITLQHPASARDADNQFQSIASKADKARESERLNDALNLYSEGVK